jgi:hypothetical protein
MSTRGLQAAPVWLQDIIAHPTWRTLIYQLSEDHKNCLLLNYALKVCSESRRSGSDHESCAFESYIMLALAF